MWFSNFYKLDQMINFVKVFNNLKLFNQVEFMIH